MTKFKKVSQEEFFQVIKSFGQNIIFHGSEEESSFRNLVYIWSTPNGLIVGKAISNSEYLKEFFLVEK